jgi:ABC-type nitrate/sulfonate/bicarbonate transport system substrate-binding protein
VLAKVVIGFVAAIIAVWQPAVVVLVASGVGRFIPMGAMNLDELGIKSVR